MLLRISQQQFLKLPNVWKHNHPILPHPTLHKRRNLLNNRIYPKPKRLKQRRLRSARPKGVHVQRRMRMARPAVKAPRLDTHSEGLTRSQYLAAVRCWLAVEQGLDRYGHYPDAVG